MVKKCLEELSSINFNCMKVAKVILKLRSNRETKLRSVLK